MRIVFRVDASRAIGTGHIRRCLALATACKSLGSEVAFITRDLGLDMGAPLHEAGVGRHAVLPRPSDGSFAPDPAVPHASWAEVSQEQDAADTHAAIDAFSPTGLPAWTPDWIVVDSYAFDARWHRAMASAFRCKIAAIDDLGDRDMACEILIDHTHASDHRAKYTDVMKSKAHVLGGPRFGLLGPAYRDAPLYAFQDSVRSIGVFMGGVDPGDQSARALEAIALAGFEGPVEIVTTSANPNLARLKEAAARRANTQVSLDLPNLAAFFARHDLQIGAGGGASWERCCIGAPTLLCVIAPNQSAVAPRLAEEGVAALAATPSANGIAQALGPLITDPERRRALSQASKALVDGLGAQRAALAMAAETLTVRPATRADAAMMFEWRNHPSTRAVSGTGEPLVWNDHRDWLERALADPTRAVFVGEIGGRSVGVIRFDFAQPRRAEVSLYCDPDLHGLGLGPALLRAGEEAADPAIIDARVLEGNIASQRLFALSGYRQTGPTRWERRRVAAKSDAIATASGLPA